MGHFAYAGEPPGGGNCPFLNRDSVTPFDVEIAEDVFLLGRKAADARVATLIEPTATGRS